MKITIPDFRRVKPPRGAQIASGWVLACSVVFLSAGCHFGRQSKPAHHPAHQQLDQTCFGYEPTVWRKMTAPCEQARRMIPEPVVQTPQPAEPQPAEPQPAVEPAPPILRDVPTLTPPEAKPGQADAAVEPPAARPLPRIFQPLDLPPVVQPADEPPTERNDRSKAVDPSTVPDPPAAADPAPPMSRFNTYPVPAVPRGTGDGSPREPAAQALFRTVQQVLHNAEDEPQPAPSSRSKRPAIGLSRFISH